MTSPVDRCPGDPRLRGPRLSGPRLYGPRLRDRRLSRRLFLGVAAGGLLAVACRRETVVDVDVAPPTLPTSGQATPTVAPSAPTPRPALATPGQAAQSAAPVRPPAPTGQGPIGLPISVDGAGVQQSRVIPALQPRTRPYTTRPIVPDHLVIPSIELDSKVIQIGTKVDDKGKLIWETAAFAVGYHRGTGLPGEPGNVVLSGHISSPREGAVFNKLPRVEPGDGVILTAGERQYLYVVREMTTVTPDAVEVLDPTDRAIVTLITCVPDGVYSHRLVVQAEAV